MAVSWNKSSEPEGPLVADRNLYLDSSNNKVVEEGDAASAVQFVAAGHAIDRADADRLGLVERDGKIVQDREAKVADHQKLFDELDGELTALYEAIAKYKEENATKDIPNTMEKARVDLETRREHARLSLSQFKKVMAGKDPLVGESQATSLRPEKSDTARDATKRAKDAIAASPSPRELAANAPTKPAEVASQHPATGVSPLAQAPSATPAAQQAAAARPAKGAAAKSAASKTASASKPASAAKKGASRRGK